MKIVKNKPSVNPGMRKYTIEVELPEDIEPGYLVYHTRNLTRFQPSVYNRPKHNSKKLTESLLTKGYDPTYPSVVMENGEMQDGVNRLLRMTDDTMHRMEKGENVSLENSPYDVYFFVDHRKGISVQERIIRRNADSTPWDGPAYLHSYCEAKIESYLQIKRIWDMFMQETKKGMKHEFGLGTIVLLATHGKYDTGSQIFKNGLLPKVDEEFAIWVLNHIKKKNVLSFGKRPTINAFCDWFSFVYPVLSKTQKETFMDKIYNYNERDEASKQFDRFREWVNLRKNTKAMKKAKLCRDSFLNEHKYFQPTDISNF